MRMVSDAAKRRSRIRNKAALFAGFLTLALVATACIIVEEDNPTTTAQTETTRRSRDSRTTDTTVAEAKDPDEETESTMPAGFAAWQKENEKLQTASERFEADPEDTDALAAMISAGDRSCELLPDAAPDDAKGFCTMWKSEGRAGFQAILDALLAGPPTTEGNGGDDPDNENSSNDDNDV